MAPACGKPDRSSMHAAAAARRRSSSRSCSFNSATLRQLVRGAGDIHNFFRSSVEGESKLPVPIPLMSPFAECVDPQSGHLRLCRVADVDDWDIALVNFETQMNPWGVNVIYSSSTRCKNGSMLYSKKRIGCECFGKPTSEGRSDIAQPTASKKTNCPVSAWLVNVREAMAFTENGCEVHISPGIYVQCVSDGMHNHSLEVSTSCGALSDDCEDVKGKFSLGSKGGGRGCMTKVWRRRKRPADMADQPTREVRNRWAERPGSDVYEWGNVKQEPMEEGEVKIKEEGEEEEGQRGGRGLGFALARDETYVSASAPASGSAVAAGHAPPPLSPEPPLAPPPLSHCSMDTCGSSIAPPTSPLSTCSCPFDDCCTCSLMDLDAYFYLSDDESATTSTSSSGCIGRDALPPPSTNAMAQPQSSLSSSARPFAVSAPPPPATGCCGMGPYARGREHEQLGHRLLQAGEPPKTAWDINVAVRTWGATPYAHEEDEWLPGVIDALYAQGDVPPIDDDILRSLLEEPTWTPSRSADGALATSVPKQAHAPPTLQVEPVAELTPTARCGMGPYGALWSCPPCTPPLSTQPMPLHLSHSERPCYQPPLDIAFASRSRLCAW